MGFKGRTSLRQKIEAELERVREALDKANDHKAESEQYGAKQAFEWALDRSGNVAAPSLLAEDHSLEETVDEVGEKAKIVLSRYNNPVACSLCMESASMGVVNLKTMKSMNLCNDCGSILQVERTLG